MYKNILITSIVMLNLQLLAEGDSVYAVSPNLNATTNSELSAENKTYDDRRLIKRAKAKLVHDQFAQKRPIPKNGGKTIEFRQFASLPKALTPLTEGVTPNGSNLTVSNITATVNQYGNYVMLTDVLELTAIDPVVQETVEIVADQGGVTLDTITREVINGGTNVSYAHTSTGTEVLSRADLDETCLLTVKEVRKQATKLKTANAQTIDGYFICIIHPHVAEDLKNDPKWEDAHKYTTPENIYEGEIGKIDKVRFIETTESKIFNDDTCPAGLAVYSCLFLGANAYATTEIEGGGMEVIIKQKGSGGTSDPLDQRSTIGWKAIKTSEILVQSFMIRFECCSSYSASAEAN